MQRSLGTRLSRVEEEEGSKTIGATEITIKTPEFNWACDLMVGNEFPGDEHTWEVGREEFCDTQHPVIIYRQE